jgi:hypothetical protein
MTSKKVKQHIISEKTSENVEFKAADEIRGDQEGLFKLVTLDRILNRITGVTSGCWWLVIVNNIPISDICQINQ